MIDNNGTVDLGELIAIGEDPAVQQLGADLDQLGLRKKRGTTLEGLLEALTAEWPDRYGPDLLGEGFAQLMQRVDIVTVAEEIRAEEKARRDHPNASLDWTRQLLATAMPQRYGDITNHGLARLLRDGGVPVQTVRLHDGTTAKGIRRRDLDEAIAARRL